MRHLTKTRVEYLRRMTIEKAERAGLAVISRREAEFAGLPEYFDGNLCPSKHIAPRYVLSGECKACRAEKWRRHTSSKT